MEKIKVSSDKTKTDIINDLNIKINEVVKIITVLKDDLKNKNLLTSEKIETINFNIKNEKSKLTDLQSKIKNIEEKEDENNELNFINKQLVMQKKLEALQAKIKAIENYKMKDIGIN